MSGKRKEIKRYKVEGRRLKAEGKRDKSARRYAAFTLALSLGLKAGS